MTANSISVRDLHAWVPLESEATSRNLGWCFALLSLPLQEALRLQGFASCIPVSSLNISGPRARSLLSACCKGLAPMPQSVSLCRLGETTCSHFAEGSSVALPRLPVVPDKTVYPPH